MMTQFFKFSRLLGRKPELTQGAGGNASIKTDGKLFVKASGAFLKNIGPKEGIVCCDLRPLKKYIRTIKYTKQKQESEFNAIAQANCIKTLSFGIPSIETGFHAIIPSKVIFHTHHAYANVPNFMFGGEKIIKSLFGKNALIISFANPGIALAKTISEKTKNLKKIPPFIFLKNHGLITHGNNPQSAYRLTSQASSKIRAYLKARGFTKAFRTIKKPADLSRHMFPDSVVYSQVDFETLPASKKQVYYEICSMVNFTTAAISALDGKPEFLEPANVRYIKNMEKEKYRIKKIKYD